MEEMEGSLESTRNGIFELLQGVPQE